MKLVATAALLLSVQEAGAETSLFEDTAGLSPAASQQLFEAACDIDVEIRGALAQVEVRQRIVNPGPTEMAATYEFDLPRGATLTGFTFRGDKGAAQALPIPGKFTTVDFDARPMIGIDPALLTAQGPGASAEYAIRVQPIGADREVLLTTRYSMVGEIRAGAIRIVLPGRTREGKLTACRGSVRASVGPGARISGFRIGKAVTAKTSATFVVDDDDVAIDATLEIAGRQPVVWTQSQPLVDGWSATLITVAAPPIKTTSAQARRALFVIDGSRSMELVGRGNVSKVVGTIAGALPAGIEIEGIIYDRTAERVFKTWKPESATTIAALQAAVIKHAPTNGSSLTGAFKLANAAITDGGRAQTVVIVISDGVLGDLSGSDLTRALDLKTSTVDVIAVVLDPAETKSPDAAALRSPVNLYGGSFVELGVDHIDDALQVVDEWLRPSWLELAMGDLDIPASVRAGSGFTRTLIHKGSPAKLVLTGHGDSAIKVAPRTGPNAPVATVTLAAIDPERPSFTSRPDPDEDERERSEKLFRKALVAHPFARDDIAYAVLSTQGNVAKNRLAMVKGGGPYERVTLVDDPNQRSSAAGKKLVTVASPSAISKLTLERLFRDQLQPKAYACYQRALGSDSKLSGTVLFELRMGRGEVTQVTLTGIVSQAFEACLEDAAYALAVPFPDFTKNADDQTIAHYPLTFNVNEARPIIILGDADSDSPLDIDAIEGGVPVKVRPNAATPLGNLRPGKQP
jgi:hypothetical protein